MEQKALSYFASVNPLAKKIVHDQRLIQDILIDEWEGFDWQKQETVLDDFFVDSTVRRKYVSVERKNPLPVSFPKLTIQSGEKIIIDMDSDFWSRQDEHSAPFSWKSKSQQDLSMADLDAEKLSKAGASKSVNKSKSVEEPATSPPEFVYNPSENFWESEKYKEKLKNYTPRSHIGKTTKNMCNNASHKTETKHSDQESNHTDNEVSITTQPHSSKESLQEKQSPVPPSRKNKTQGSKGGTKPIRGAKVSLSSSFSKKRNVEEQQDLMEEPEAAQQLKDFPKAHKDIESNVFDNPVMNVQERKVAEEEAESISSAGSSPSRRPLLREPGQQMMDRNTEEDTEIHHVSSTRKDSTESGHGDRIGLLKFDDNEFQNAELSVPDTAAESSMTNSSSIPTTGFGFLDNW